MDVDMTPTCDYCDEPATTLDGTVGARLCNNPGCLDRAWGLSRG